MLHSVHVPNFLHLAHLACRQVRRRIISPHIPCFDAGPTLVRHAGTFPEACRHSICPTVGYARPVNVWRGPERMDCKPKGMCVEGSSACLRRLTCLHSAGHNRSGGLSQNASNRASLDHRGEGRDMRRKIEFALAIALGLAVASCASLSPPAEVVTREGAAPISLSDCLEIEDQTKERLDCYDGLVVAATEPAVVSCRAVVEQDARLNCFNKQFAGATPISAPAAPLRIASAPTVALRPVPAPPTRTYFGGGGGAGGCGSRGGPGYRLASGKCASHRSGVRSRSGYRVRSGYRSRTSSSYRRRR